MTVKHLLPRELIEKFSLERVSKNAAVFDFQKLQWMNGVYIRELSLDEFYKRALPYLQQAGLVPEEMTADVEEKARKVLSEMQSRVKLVSEVVEMSRYFFTDDFAYDEKAVAKFLLKDQAADILSFLRSKFAEVDSFAEASLAPAFEAAMAEFDLKLGKVIPPLRVALTGTNVSPGIYEVLEILGKETVLRRIDRALALIAENSEE